MKNELLTTSAAAKIAGVGVTSIKRWADQELIRVTRTPGGHRRILKADLLRFLQDSATHPTSESDESTGGVLADPGNVYTPTFGRTWADEILQGDVHDIQAALLSARSRLGSWFRVTDEVSLGLRDIGRRWADGRISVVDEHIASEQLSRALDTISYTMASSARHPVCLLVCLEDELHTLALSFLQLCLREAGWQPVWVGASTPVDHLCARVSEGDTNMVAISVSASWTQKHKLETVAGPLVGCCREFSTRLVMGGEGAQEQVLDYAEFFSSFVAFGATL